MAGLIPLIFWNGSSSGGDWDSPGVYDVGHGYQMRVGGRCHDLLKLFRHGQEIWDYPIREGSDFSAGDFRAIECPDGGILITYRGGRLHDLCGVLAVYGDEVHHSGFHRHPGDHVDVDFHISDRFSAEFQDGGRRLWISFDPTSNTFRTR